MYSSLLLKKFKTNKKIEMKEKRVSHPAGIGVREIESKGVMTERNAERRLFGVNSLTASVYIDWICLGLHIINIYFMFVYVHEWKKLLFALSFSLYIPCMSHKEIECLLPIWTEIFP